MNNCFAVKFTILIALFLCFSGMLFGQNFHDYKNSKDSLEGKITIDNNLHSEFFDSHETSYPWYILKNDDGKFESAMGLAITEEDKVPVEHTSNCVSTHRGNHKMDFCHAKLGSDNLQLEVYGGLPAYASSLMIQIKDSKFSCFFRATYPFPVKDLKWKILSKELIIKNKNFKKGERLYARISVEFEETSIYQGKKIKGVYKIEGYVKPIIN